MLDNSEQISYLHITDTYRQEVPRSKISKQENHRNTGKLAKDFQCCHPQEVNDLLAEVFLCEVISCEKSSEGIVLVAGVTTDD